jgi:hypothetical protein
MIGKCCFSLQVNMIAVVRNATAIIFMLNNVMKRDMNTAKEIRAVKADIGSCFYGCFANHPKVHIVLTQLIRKLYRLEKRSTWINSLRLK